MEAVIIKPLHNSAYAAVSRREHARFNGLTERVSRQYILTVA
jgi:hypothetical protein